MAEFGLAVPGYAALPSRGGPDVFDNVPDPSTGTPLAWTDQMGLRSGTDVAFNGRAGQRRFDFHFPFTTPVAFGAGDTAIVLPFPNSHRHNSPTQKMAIHAVYVTFRTDPGVFVNRIRVFDRLALIFDTNSTVGPLGLSSPTTWSNTLVTGQNRHFFTRTISNSIGVTVTVDFGRPGGPNGLITFTGAGIGLSSP